MTQKTTKDGGATAAVRNYDEDKQKDLPPAWRFILGGQEWTVRNALDVPFGTVLRIYNAVATGDDEQLALQIGPFFTSVLIEEQAEDFAKLLLDPRSPLTMRRMKDVVSDVVEAIMGRPTTPARSSSTTRRAARARSGAGSSSRGTRRT